MENHDYHAIDLQSGWAKGGTLDFLNLRMASSNDVHRPRFEASIDKLVGSQGHCLVGGNLDVGVLGNVFSCNFFTMNLLMVKVSIQRFELVGSQRDCPVGGNLDAGFLGNVLSCNFLTANLLTVEVSIQREFSRLES